MYTYIVVALNNLPEKEEMEMSFLDYGLVYTVVFLVTIPVIFLVGYWLWKSYKQYGYSLRTLVLLLVLVGVWFAPSISVSILALVKGAPHYVFFVLIGLFLTGTYSLYKYLTTHGGRG